MKEIDNNEIKSILFDLSKKFILPKYNNLDQKDIKIKNDNDIFTCVDVIVEEEFDTSVENMSSLIEPIMIVFMGTMIGGLMIAMYSPIFNVGAIIGG